VWAEQLKASAPDAEVLLRYGTSNGWLDGQPAVLTRPFGKGNITYIGAVLDEKLMAAAAQWMVRKSGVTPAFGTVPEGVDVSARQNAQYEIFVLINFGQATQHVALPHPMKVLLGAGDGSGLDLPPYGVEVLLDSK
jgi:beta-galactosidase